MNKKQILVFGGAFNPPLNSHFSLAEQIKNEYKEIEKIIFVPVSDKYKKEGLINDEHRYQMLKLVCDKNINFEVSRVEIDSPRQYYTIETLNILKDIYPDNEIAFLMGSDNLKELDTWKRGEELIKNFKIYVLERGKDNIEKIFQEHKILNENRESFIKAQNNIVTNLSSTFVREKIKNGHSIKYLAPEEVIDYIDKNKLYL